MDEKTSKLTPEMLESLRNRISEIDLDILELLETRVSIATQIGLWKKENNLPIYAPEVEANFFLLVVNIQVWLKRFGRLLCVIPEQ